MVPMCKYPVGEGAILVLTFMQQLYQPALFLYNITVMTLSQTALITRQAITLTIIVLIAGILTFIGYRVWYAYYLAHLPPKEPIPDTKFGVLPMPDFPQKDVSSSNYTYSIDTSTGNLPKLGVDQGFDKIIKVYFVTKVYATLLSSEKSRDLAAKFNIQKDPQVLSDTNYLYQDGDKSLNVNLDSGNFIYSKEASPSAKQTLDEDNKLVSDFQNFLSGLGLLRDELKGGTSRVVLLKRDGNKFIPTTLHTEAEAAQISLWPQSIDKKPLLTSDFNKALTFAIVKKGAASLDDYLSLNFAFWPIDQTTFATYPAKTLDQAFDDLKSGKGVVITQPPKPQVSISSIYPAYFVSENYNPYLLPIYVFEGPQFVSYVPAITEQFQSPAK